MTSLEKAEIKRLPLKYKPMSGWKYMWYSLLFMIPVVGLVFLIIFSVKDTNINRRSFARSYFCVMLFMFIAAIVIMAVIVALMASGAISQDVINKYVQYLVPAPTPAPAPVTGA